MVSNPRAAAAAYVEAVSDGIILHEYEPYLRERWNYGCTNATLLWQEIRARGYPGGYSSVRDHLARFRGNARMPDPAPQPPEPRTAAAWIMTRPDDLDPADGASLDAILASSPELAAPTAHVRAFAAIMTGRRGRELEQWMTAAADIGEPALASFVTGLRADQDAVTAGLTRNQVVDRDHLCAAGAFDDLKHRAADPAEAVDRDARHGTSPGAILHT